MPVPPAVLWPVSVVGTPLVKGHERTPDGRRGGWKWLPSCWNAGVNHLFGQGVDCEPE